MASIRKLYPKGHPKYPESPWVVEYTDANGKRRRKTPKSGLQKDADALRRKIEREMDDGAHVADSQTATVASTLNLWLRECEARAKIGDKMTFGTVAMYATCAKRVDLHLGTRKLTAIDAGAIQSMIDALVVKLSPTSVHHTKMALKLMFDFAIGAKLIKRNPVRDNRVRMPAKVWDITIPSKDALHRLLAAAKTRAYDEREQTAAVRRVAFCMAVFSTMRRGEICGLKWSNVYLDEAVIRIRQSLSRTDGLKGTKTKNGVREVTIASHLRDALEALPGRRDPDAFVLTTREGTPVDPNDMTNLYWRGLAKKAGLAHPNGRPMHRLHDLRHAAASLMIGEGLSPIHVRDAMGHASVNTTLGIYGHLFPEDQAIKRTANAISAQF